MAKKQGTSMIFLNPPGRILLVLRDQKDDIPFPGCWDVPGGHVEEDESPQECIRREMREELRVEIGTPTLFRRYDLADRVEFTFWQYADDDLDKVRLYEGQRSQWFTQEQIAAMPEHDLAFGFKGILLDFYRERPFETASE